LGGNPLEKRKTYLLEELTWKEAAALFKTDIAMINLGAIHPHGDGALLGTDNLRIRSSEHD
jgi:creatinine amidohydrolase/Fe(II)-dependent formamide hydrolase-like protein